jgi:hypothetical protein
MVWSVPRILNIGQLTQFLDDGRFKITALITVKAARESVIANKLLK